MSVMKSNTCFKPNTSTPCFLKKLFTFIMSLLKKSKADGWSYSIDYETSIIIGLPYDKNKFFNKNNIIK
jgi:hypothetical protein